MKDYLKENKLIIAAVFIVLLFGVFSVDAAWCDINATWCTPTAAPTGGNAPEPINDSAVTQYKGGLLGVGSLSSDTNIFTNKIGIGVFTVSELSGNKKLVVKDGDIVVNNGVISADPNYGISVGNVQIKNRSLSSSVQNFSGISKSGGSLTPGQNYCYKITATVGGLDVNSVSWCGVVGAGNGSLELSWNSLAGASGYKIYGRPNNQNGTFGLITSLTGTSFTDNGSITPGSAQPPTGITTDISGIGAMSLIGSLGIGAANPSDVMFAVSQNALDNDKILKLSRAGATYPAIFRIGTDNALVINNDNIDTLTLKGGNLNVSGSLTASGNKGVCLSDGTNCPAGSQWTTSGSNIYYNSGNVGIGTTDPGSYRLKVDGNIFGTSLDVTNIKTNDLTASSQISVDGGIITIRPGVSGTSQGKKPSESSWRDWSNFNNWDFNSSQSDTCPGADNTKDFSCTGYNSASCYDRANVVIGSTNYGSATRQLSCVAESGNYALVNEGNSLRFKNGAGTTKFLINQDGNVGIGTTSPAAKFEVSGSGEVARFSGSNPYITIGGLTSATGGYIQFANSNMYISPHQITAMTINSSGNVGIGTTSPGYKLTVDTNISDWATRTYNAANGSYFYAAHGSGYGAHINAGSNASSGTYALEVMSAGATRLYVRGDGKVGIGTTSVTSGYMLEVAGAVKATSFSSGDILFNHNGKVVWRMYEDEDGLYVESSKTKKHYRIKLEEL